MNNRIQSLIDRMASTAVTAISLSNELKECRDCRFGVFDQDRSDMNSFVWICLDTLEIEEPKGSGKKMKKIWAHTNDFDGMVYGWSNCEFSIIETNLLTVMSEIVDFLMKKFKDAQRIRVQYQRTAPDGQSLPTLVAESDTFDGDLKPMPEFPSLC